MIEAAIETERLRLTLVEQSDVDALHRHWILPGVRRYLWDNEVISREWAAAQVTEAIERYGASGLPLWTLRLEDGAPPIGCVCLRPVGDKVEVLYSIDPRDWGRGLAVEAARAALEFGFERLELEEIIGRTDPPNASSRRVLEKLGMEFIRRELVNGVDLERYVIRREDFPRSRASRGSAA